MEVHASSRRRCFLTGLLIVIRGRSGSTPYIQAAPVATFTPIARTHAKITAGSAWSDGRALRARPSIQAEAVVIFVCAGAIGANFATGAACVHGILPLLLLITI